jgi:hypothetical protein
VGRELSATAAGVKKYSAVLAAATNLTINCTRTDISVTKSNRERMDL